MGGTRHKEYAKLNAHDESVTDNPCLTCVSGVLLEPPSVDLLKSTAENDNLPE